MVRRRLIGSKSTPTYPLEELEFDRLDARIQRLMELHSPGMALEPCEVWRKRLRLSYWGQKSKEAVILIWRPLKKFYWL